MAKKVMRPTIKVQPVYSGTADMREVFISLLVDAVRHGKCPVRTFENVKDTHYNEGRNQTKNTGYLRKVLLYSPIFRQKTVYCFQ